MNYKINKNNDLITRFSSSLLGNGRKQSGHKIFLESLFLVRSNDEKEFLSLKSVTRSSSVTESSERSKASESSKLSKERFQGREKYLLSLLRFLRKTGLPVKSLQNGITKWNHQHGKEGFSKKNTRYNDYKNISLSLLTQSDLRITNNNGEMIPRLDKTSYKEAPLSQKKRSNTSSRDAFKISDTTKNKDLPRKESSTVVESFQPSTVVESFQPSTVLVPRSVNETFFRKQRTRLSKESVESVSDLRSLKRTISQFANKEFLEICKNNVKPVIETRNIRKGRVTYKVPLVTRPERQQGKAVSWLIDNASLRRKKKDGLPLETINSNTFLSKAIDDRKNNYRSMKSSLASLLADSFVNTGESVERRKELHKIALKNRSYTSYRWW